MGGKFVCQKTTLELALRVVAEYDKIGQNAKLVENEDDGTFQVVVRGLKNTKYSPAGVTNSFGKKVRPLHQLNRELWIQTRNS